MWLSCFDVLFRGWGLSHRWKFVAFSGARKAERKMPGRCLFFFFFFLAWFWVGETGREGRRVEKVVEEGPKMKFQFVPMHSTKLAEQPINEK